MNVRTVTLPTATLRAAAIALRLQADGLDRRARRTTSKAMQRMLRRWARDAVGRAVIIEQVLHDAH